MQSSHFSRAWLEENVFQCLSCSGERVPLPLQRGQVLSSAASIAERMNSDLLVTPSIAFASDSSTLKVTTFVFISRKVIRNITMMQARNYIYDLRGILLDVFP